MKKFNKSDIMKLAWQFVKTSGQTLSECLKIAWRNFKLLNELKTSIVKFYFQKVDGSIREAYGTLKVDIETTGDQRKKNETVQTYFDTEVQEFRCFKKLNLIKF